MDRQVRANLLLLNICYAFLKRHHPITQHSSMVLSYSELRSCSMTLNRGGSSIPYSQSQRYKASVLTDQARHHTYLSPSVSLSLHCCPSTFYPSLPSRPSFLPSFPPLTLCVVCLLGITGPDANHPNVSNDIFTMVSVSLGLHWARYYSCLCQRSEIEEVPESIVDTALYLRLPFDYTRRTHGQFKGFNPG